MQEQIEKITQERNEALSDIKLLKDNLFKFLGNLGLVNDDGTIKEKPSMIVLMPKIMKYLTSADLVKKDLGFMVELLPLLQKYKNL